ncbi:MAG: TIGR02679 domain-containing protein [Ornithinibacter sp.]
MPFSDSGAGPLERRRLVRDDDRRLASVVLRAVAMSVGTPPPVDAGSRRDLWAAFGVVVGSVSATCLV